MERIEPSVNSPIQGILNRFGGKRIYIDGKLYLSRWHIFGDGSGRGWEIYLHHLHEVDSYRWLHNHPWPWFLSIVLWGSYRQEVFSRNKQVKKTQHIRWINLFRGQDRYHSLRELPRGHAWTLVVIPAKNDHLWGYWNETVQAHEVDDNRNDPEAGTFTVDFDSRREREEAD